jgi:hypothetical protein
VQDNAIQGNAIGVDGAAIRAEGLDAVDNCWTSVLEADLTGDLRKALDRKTLAILAASATPTTNPPGIRRMSAQA